MEGGIFALAGVILGAAAVKFAEVRAQDIKFFKRSEKRRKNEKDAEEEKMSMTQQWENLLNYDGRK